MIIALIPLTFGLYCIIIILTLTLVLPVPIQDFNSEEAVALITLSLSAILTAVSALIHYLSEICQPTILKESRQRQSHCSTKHSQKSQETRSVPELSYLSSFSSSNGFLKKIAKRMRFFSVLKSLIILTCVLIWFKLLIIPIGLEIFSMIKL